MSTVNKISFDHTS